MNQVEDKYGQLVHFRYALYDALKQTEACFILFGEMTMLDPRYGSLVPQISFQIKHDDHYEKQ